MKLNGMLLSVSQGPPVKQSQPSSCTAALDKTSGGDETITRRANTADSGHKACDVGPNFNGLATPREPHLASFV